MEQGLSYHYMWEKERAAHEQTRRERDEARNLRDQYEARCNAAENGERKAGQLLAAAQVRIAELEAALEAWWQVDLADGTDIGEEDMANLMAEAKTKTTRALSASSPNAALREVCRKVQGATWAAAGPTVEMDAKKCNVILDAILGPEVTR